MLGVAIFAGLWYWICKTDIGYAFTHAVRQPLFVALPIGIIMGDVKTAIIIGAAVQLLYIGLVAAGSNLPADDCLAGLIAIPIAVQTGLSPELAIAIAVPVGILGVFIDQIRKTVNVVFVHMADRYAEDVNTKGIKRAAIVYPTILSFFMRFPVPFLAIMFGPEAVTSFMKIIPEWLTHGFSVAGGILPALGFALTIFVIGKPKLLPWFFIGYFLVQFSGIPVFGAAIFGICVVLLITNLEKMQMNPMEKVKQEPKKDNQTVTEKDVRRAWLYYYIIAEMGISYERLQALGWCTSLIPILERLYPDREELKAALNRHLVFYNTEAVYGSVINGVVIAMEQQRAAGEDITDDAITGIKTGLMGPMAGIGDSIDWATLKPIIFGLAATLSATGSPIGCFVLLLLPIIQVIVGLNLSAFGFRAGKESIRTILKSGMINELIMGASTLGLYMMGALSSTYIKLSTPIAFSISAQTEPFVLQSVLDGIVPGLLPLLAVWGIYWWLKKKNQNFAVITVLILVISIVGAVIGLL